MKQSDFVIPQGKLGIELPDREEELFQIHDYPLFDREFAMDVLGNEAFVAMIFESFREDNEKDMEDIKDSFECGDLKEVQRIAQKLKSSALYGTIRLHLAMLFLERYLYAGHTHCVDRLYAQMLDVMNLTLKELEAAGLIKRQKLHS